MDFAKNMLKGIMSEMNLTPKSIAASLDAIINQELAKLTKEEKGKDPTLINCFFEMSENANRQSPPFIKMIGLYPERKIRFIKDIDLDKDIIRAILDDGALAMLAGMASAMNFDINEQLPDFFKSINETLFNEMVDKGHKIVVMILVGKEKLIVNLCDDKRNALGMPTAYKKNFDFNDFIKDI